MTERPASDKDVAGLTRAYIARVHDDSTPSGLEDRAIVYAFSRGRTKLAARFLGGALIVVISALTAVGVLAFHHDAQPSAVPTPSSAAQIQLHVVRFPGKVVLPSLDRTISDRPIVARLATDIRSLPLFPRDERCAASDGTYYSLTFTPAGAPSWTASIGAQGCEVVQIADQPLRWAAHSPQLWADLATALGLRPDQIQPSVCIDPAMRNCAPLVAFPIPPAT